MENFYRLEDPSYNISKTEGLKQQLWMGLNVIWIRVKNKILLPVFALSKHIYNFCKNFFNQKTTQNFIFHFSGCAYIAEPGDVENPKVKKVVNIHRSVFVSPNAESGCAEVHEELEEYESTLQIPEMRKWMLGLLDAFASGDIANFYIKKGALMLALSDDPSRWLNLFYLLYKEGEQFGQFAPMLLTEWLDAPAFTPFPCSYHPLFTLLNDKKDSISHVIQGICHEKGWGVELDLHKALDAYEKATDGGDHIGIYHLCHLSQKMSAEPMTLSEVEEFFSPLSGPGGLGAANLLLAKLAEDEENIETACKFYGYASAQGVAEAQIWGYANQHVVIEKETSHEQRDTPLPKRFLDIVTAYNIENYAEQMFEYACLQNHAVAYLLKAETLLKNGEYRKAKKLCKKAIQQKEVGGYYLLGYVSELQMRTCSDKPVLRAKFLKIAERMYRKAMQGGSLRGAVCWGTLCENELLGKKGFKFTREDKDQYLQLTKDVEDLPEDMEDMQVKVCVLRSFFVKKFSPEYYSTQCCLAKCYFHGKGGVQKNVDQAQVLLKKIQKQSEEATRLLTKFYEFTGKEFEKEGNIPKARLYYLEAAKLGFPDKLKESLGDWDVNHLWLTQDPVLIKKSLEWQLSLAEEWKLNSIHFVAKMFLTADKSRQKILKDIFRDQTFIEWGGVWTQIAHDLQTIEESQDMQKKGESYYRLASPADSRGTFNLPKDAFQIHAWLQEAALSGHVQAALKLQRKLQRLMRKQPDWFRQNDCGKIAQVLLDTCYAETLQKAVNESDPASCIRVAEILQSVGNQEKADNFFVLAEELAIKNRNWKVLRALKEFGRDCSARKLMGITLQSVLESISSDFKQNIEEAQQSYNRQLALCKKDSTPDDEVQHNQRYLTLLAERLMQATQVERLKKLLEEFDPSVDGFSESSHWSEFCLNAGKILVSKNWSIQLLGDYREQGCFLLDQVVVRGQGDENLEIEQSVFKEAKRLLQKTVDEVSYDEVIPKWLEQFVE